MYQETTNSIDILFTAVSYTDKGTIHMNSRRMNQYGLLVDVHMSCLNK